MTGESYVQPLVLILEDEPHTWRFLVSALASHGFRSLQVGTRAPDLGGLVGHQPHLVLLDAAHAADAVGLTLQVRSWTPAPIIVLLDAMHERERGELLDAGANDYVTKPFGAGDLLARMRVWLRQNAREARGLAVPGPTPARLRIDRERQAVFVEGREVHLTPTECALLMALTRGRGPVTEEELVAAVWGPRGRALAGQHLRSHLRQLRNKIEPDPMRPRHLVTEAGGGYRLKLG
jgi:two-component system KDP operon response regulator KdpE